MGSKTRLSSYCTKRGDDTANLVTSRKTNARLARPIRTGHAFCRSSRYRVVGLLGCLCVCSLGLNVDFKHLRSYRGSAYL